MLKSAVMKCKRGGEAVYHHLGNDNRYNALLISRSHFREIRILKEAEAAQFTMECPLMTWANGKISQVFYEFKEDLSLVY